MDTAIVVGAGIGGLTTAAALQRADCAVTVLERAPELVAVGAGLTIQPNAVWALRNLGLAEPLLEVAAHLRAPAVRASSGRLLAGLDGEQSDRLQAAVGAPALGVHRATLQQLLLDALTPDTDVRLGAEVVGLEPDGRGVRLADGTELSADIVIGADGLRSTIRTELLGDEPPRYSGYYCWRGVAEIADLPAGWPGTGAGHDRAAGSHTAGHRAAGEWAAEYWGSGVRFGGCAIDGERVYWFATANGEAGGADTCAKGEAGRAENPAKGEAGRAENPANGEAGGADTSDAKAAAAAAVAGFADEVQELLAATPADAVFRTDIHDRDPVDRWGAGAATLLGDAAHPMTPNLGQGACQAIVDALVLAVAVEAVGARPAALRDYERKRIPRTANVVRAARRAGEVGQWSDPLRVRLRDTAARLTPAPVLARQLRSFWG